MSEIQPSSPASYAPKGFRSVTSYFTVEDAKAFLVFVQGVFQGEVLHQAEVSSGRIQHAEVRIGDSIIEVSDAHDAYPARRNTLHVFVPDADACYERALAAGAVSVYEPADMPYGERSAGIEDAFGNHWYIATFTGGEGKGYYS
ncbi:VOC family protein [Paenibacillus sp. GCM10023252]|uniref:VOC family protein n=1 Tax=Paenibacillus sp. GCM10023252 TaxID=3252649 RepID=UPI00361FB04E